MQGPRLSVTNRSIRPSIALIAAALAAAPWGALATVADADVVVLTPARDTSIYDNGNANGAGDAIFSGMTGPFGNHIVQRGLLVFDVAGGVPAGAQVLGASVELTLVQTSATGGPSSHTLQRLTADWGEGTSSAPGGSGAPPTTGDATWTNTFFPDQLWTAPGGDFDATVSASQTVGPTLGPYTWGATPQLINDVQSMLDNPAANFGWILIGDEATEHSSKKFASKDSGDADLFPKLTVEFVVPCPWDCADGDGVVGINDFLALLAQWGGSGTSCDFGAGPAGVGIDEFLDLLAHWGPCP